MTAAVTLSASNPSPAGRRTLTDVERRVSGSGEVVDVGDPEGLDGHGAHPEQQLCAGHQQPQRAAVAQTRRLLDATRLRRVGAQAADVMTTWENTPIIKDDRRTAFISRRWHTQEGSSK